MSTILSKLTSFFTLSIALCFLSVHAKDVDLADNPKFAHAMQVETRKINDFPVVFHYGQVRPDFNDISDNSYRVSKSLDGKWSFRFDPEAIGIDESWFAVKNDSSDWQEVVVPHCWDAMPGSLYWHWSDQSIKNPAHYNGSAWYKRSFEWEPSKGMCQRIAFLSVQQRVRVYLNGKEIAMHEGGGAPFSVDVTEHLITGSNNLVLKVSRLPNFKKKADGKGWDELRYVHTMHPKAPDCWPYAGILRSVDFIEESEISIRKTQIHTSNGKLHAAAIISNHSSKETTINVALKSTVIAVNEMIKKDIKIPAGQTRVIKFSSALSKKTTRWSTTSPTLYEAHVYLEDTSGATFDKLSSSFGVREFTTQDSNFMLNGKPIFLKGASVYDEHIERGGAITKEDHKNLFKLAIDSKCNFIRMHVTQRDPYTYQLADKLGILICGEWGGFWYEEESMKAQTKDKNSIYQTMGRCAVWDLMNHPSVVLWGLHNESHQYGDNYGEFIKMGQSLVREIDTVKRPITWSAWHPYHGDPNYHLADAVGFNEYRGTFDPFEKLDPDMAKTIKRNPNKPLIILENGAWATRGNRGKVDKQDTEDWQADLLKRQWKVLSKHSPGFAGYTYWLLTDYRSRKPYTGKKKANGYSRMGVYDESGNPKMVRDIFRNLPDPLAR